MAERHADFAKDGAQVGGPVRSDFEHREEHADLSEVFVTKLLLVLGKIKLVEQLERRGRQRPLAHVLRSAGMSTAICGSGGGEGGSGGDGGAGGRRAVA